MLVQDQPPGLCMADWFNAEQVPHLALESTSWE
jgi:hypothetical protein